MIAPARPPLAPPDIDHELLTADETIRYLRLDTDDRDAHERLRSLHRYQGLPRLKRGRLILYRRSDVDAWLAGEHGGRRR